MNSGITIRMGAAHYDLKAGDVVINLATASKTERYETRKTVMEHLRSSNYFGTKHNRKNMRRHRKAKA